MSADDLHRTAEQRLEAGDQRYTVGRRRLVDTLAGMGAPATLPELLARRPDLAQSSAYRNLAVLEEVGVVRRLVHGTGYAYYELAEDLTEHHHHLVCIRCGTVRDVTLGAAVERSLDREAHRISDIEGFVPTHHTIDIHGVCDTCSAMAPSER